MRTDERLTGGSTKERAIIEQLLTAKRWKILRARLERMHPADVAEYFEHYSVRDQTILLSAVDDELAADIISELDPEDSFSVLQGLGARRVVDILDTLAADEKVDILAQFPEDRMDELLGLMEAEEAQEAKELLQFDEESAGGLMTTELLYFSDTLTCAETLEKIREYQDELETANYIFITDSQKHLVGVVTLRQLIISAPDNRIGHIMERDVVTVGLEDDQEDVAAIVSKYDLLAVPVVDELRRLRGIVTVDDVIDVIEDEATEDMYRMVGLDEEEEITDSALGSAVRRLPWLTFTLFGALCSGSILIWFHDTISQFTALLVFMPAIMGMGGNTGLQSSTIVVRGLATGEIDRSIVFQVAFREVRVGLILGIMVGVIVTCVCIAWQQHLIFGLVVGTAMLCQISVAVAEGMVIPLFLDRVGLDPAIAAGPIVTMISDINGLLIYFGIATLLLKYLV